MALLNSLFLIRVESLGSARVLKLDKLGLLQVHCNSNFLTQIISSHSAAYCSSKVVVNSGGPFYQHLYGKTGPWLKFIKIKIHLFHLITHTSNITQLQYNKCLTRLMYYIEIIFTKFS